MKKNIVILLIIALFLSTLTAFAELELDLKGHWAESVVDKQFMKDHFKYVLIEDLKATDLNNTLDKQYLLLSLYTMLNEHQKEIIEKNTDKENIENAVKFLVNKEILEKDASMEGKVRRKEVVKYVMKTIELSKEIQLTNTNFIPFKDILGLEDEYKMYISKANMINIVKGYGDSTFRPEENTTVAEGIIFLQRLRGEIEEMNKNIPFKVVEEKWYGTGTNNLITTSQSSNKIKVAITKEFPTSGYNFTVNRVEKYAHGKYKIHVDIKSPAPNSILLQVMSYKTITIELDRNLIDRGDYKFEVSGATPDVETR